MKTLTTLRTVPPFIVGHVRDLRVRWALEEAGIPYEVRLVDEDDRVSPAYRRQQPFGQIPVLQDGELTLFESGAILMHLGEQSPVLLPRDAQGRIETTMWMFAALNTVEPAVGSYADLLFFSGDEGCDAERRAPLEAEALKRLQELDTWLAQRDYLTGRFTVADILMTTVLHLLEQTDLVARFPALRAYHARCKGRAAFKKAFADQVALYTGEEVPA
jgi:glutathione S-transferase